MYSKESAESQETDSCVTLPVLSYGSKWITPYFQLYYTHWDSLFSHFRSSISRERIADTQLLVT